MKQCFKIVLTTGRTGYRLITKGEIDMGSSSIVRSAELDSKSFRAFGQLLVPDTGAAPDVFEDNLFRFFVTYTVGSAGWQIGYLDQVGRTLDKVERHPNTPEVFAPLTGSLLLVLTNEPEARDSYVAFKLEKPIVLSPGVWHGVIALSLPASALIVENSDVLDEYYQLPHTLKGESV